MPAPPHTRAPAGGRIEASFHPAVEAWFREQFPAGATQVQQQGWASIASGANTLLSAPTGSGKTLAAFLWGLSELVSQPVPEKLQRLRVLYISPLRALNYDIERNLRAPLAGIQRHAQQMGLDIPQLQVGVRTGDTSQKERSAHRRNPPDVFITTPESLYVMLTSGARELFDNVQHVIVDEIHALASTKRGTHMSISLERLEERVARHGDGRQLQRIALSATQRPIERIAAFVGGAGRSVNIIEAPQDKRYDLKVCVPVDDMTAIGAPIATDLADLDTPESNAGTYSIWSALYGELLDHVEQHRSTIVFTNSRRLSERIALALNELSERRAFERSLEELQVGDAAVDPEDADAVGSDPGARDDGAAGAAAVEQAEHGELDAFFERHADGGEPIEPAAESWAGVPAPAAGVVARAHHGSIARETRKQIEEQLKAGMLPAIIATSSLELGIDMGAVDLVLHIESPKSVASGIQRIGRAGHNVGDVSIGRIYPKHRMDLVESAAVSRAIVHGQIEPVHIPELALDVLAQQVVAIAAEDERPVDELFALVTRAWPYRELSREQFDNLLGLLSGYFPGDDLADLRPRLVWDRDAGTVVSRSDAARIAITNAGTIPDRGLFGVFLADGKTRVGELDEEMVHETRLGDVIVLGATSWRVENVTRDRVLVTPVPGAIGKTPFWHGEGLGRTSELGRAVGELVRRIAAAPEPADAAVDARETGAEPQLEAGEAAEFEAGDHVHPEADLHAQLEADYLLERRAAVNLVNFVREQQEATGEVPSDQTIVVERFRDELGDWRICILSPFGKAIHGPWAMAIEQQVNERHDLDVNAMWSDDGIALRLPDTDTPIPVESLLVDPDQLEDLVIGQLAQSSLFASRFREIVTRALLLPLARFDRRSPLWLQRIKAYDVLRVAQRHATFPMILETYRECMRDVFDLPALRQLLQQLHDRRLRLVEVETRHASPFAASLLFDYTANLLYDDDRPAAERRAQALSLDQSLLRELLGTDDIRDLLDLGAIEAVHDELQRLVESRRARHVDAVHDLLRELGDLSAEEVADRTQPREAAAEALARLEAGRRVVRLQLGAETRHVAIEDVGAYRDALGVQPPQGVPDVFLTPQEGSLERLVARYSRTRTPFRSDELARRWGVAPARIEPVLAALRERGELLHGGFLPAGSEPEWCDAEVLRRIRRRTLALLRKEIEPASELALARFVTAWHMLSRPPAGSVAALRDTIVQLEGFEASPHAWENDLLIPRLSTYRGAWLDELVQTGQVVWMGRGVKHGSITVALFLREHFELMAPEAANLPDDEPNLRLVRDALAQRGASFLGEIAQATGLAHSEALRALWRLAALGHCTNDAWQTLRVGADKTAARALQGRRGGTDQDASRPAPPATRGSRHSMRRGVRRSSPAAQGDVRFQGRWSLLSLDRAGEQEQIVAWSEALLDCYGVVTRGAAHARNVSGGFSAVYRELSRQEEVGAVRRGYFVEGLGGAQFALPEAVDRLRAVREASPTAPPVVVLRATDPAQPYGALVPWPSRDDLPQPARTANSYVLLRDGELVATLSLSGKSLTLYEPDALAAIAAALTTMLEQRRVDRLAIEQVNGRDLEPEQVAAFANTAFVRTPRGVRATRATLQQPVRGARPGMPRPTPAGGAAHRRDYGEHSDVSLPSHGRSARQGRP